MNKHTKLFVCASCEWIFKKVDPEYGGCPKCNFAYYGAHFVYGNKAYRYFATQKPWKDKKMANYDYELGKEIRSSTDYVEKDKNVFNLMGIKMNTKIEWQPISSATKDETRILVTLVGLTWVAWWNKNEEAYQIATNEFLDMPTHWMPCIDPPVCDRG